MEISVKIPFQYITKQRLSIDEEKFNKDLIEFIDKLENQYFFDINLYDKLVGYGVNKNELDKMMAEVETYASYDENHEEIGFPYEEWIDRLLEVYTDTRQNNG